jgi:hypothetical protein
MMMTSGPVILRTCTRKISKCSEFPVCIAVFTQTASVALNPLAHFCYCPVFTLWHVNHTTQVAIRPSSK